MRRNTLHHALQSAALAALTLATATSAVRAGSISAVRLDPPEPLLTGIVYGQTAGTWYQATHVSDGTLTAELTLQLPPAGTPGEPGPVVAVWQLVVRVADATFGDIASRKIGPPQTTSAMPNCDADGNCALRLHVEGMIAPALEAQDLEWAGETGLGVGITAVRSFDDGRLLQAVAPGWVVDGAGGTLAQPEDMFGALTLSSVMSPSDTPFAELPGDQFGLGSDERFDWGSAVAAALAQSGEQTPQPIPINVWTPEQPDALHVQLRLDFASPCPDQRAIVFRDNRTGEVGAMVVLDGARLVKQDVALPLTGSWAIGLETGDGTVLNATDLQPLGEGTGLVVGGPLDCTNGKGVFTQEGIPQTIPNPSEASATPGMSSSTSSSPSPSASVSGSDDVPPTSTILLAAAFVIAVGSVFVVLRKRRIRALISPVPGVTTPNSRHR